MSFDYNPYNHIELVKSDGGVRVHCHSCGGARPKSTEAPLSPATTIAEAFRVMAEHVRTSHARTPDDFEGWSDY